MDHKLDWAVLYSPFWLEKDDHRVRLVGQSAMCLTCEDAIKPNDKTRCHHKEISSDLAVFESQTRPDRGGHWVVLGHHVQRGYLSNNKVRVLRGLDRVISGVARHLQLGAY